MTSGEEWQGRVGHNWAGSHQATDRAFRGITAELVKTIDTLPGRVMLDIGCGAGELALALTQRRPDAVMTGVDISPDLIASARARAGDDARCRFAVSDVLDWQPDRAPDLLVSRHGVMFFDDPVRAFSHLHSIAAPGASLAFTCFRDLADNPWATEPSRAVGRAMSVADGYAPGPFGFRDRDWTAAMLAAAGWRDITMRRADTAFIAGEGDEAVDQATAFFARIGPAAAALAAMAPEPRADGLAALRRAVAAMNKSGRVAPAASIWVVSATR